MPHEDKEKKRFKAVTEEITTAPPVEAPRPVIETPPPMPVEEVQHVPPKIEPVHVAEHHHEPKHEHHVEHQPQVVSVAETNNLNYGVAEKPKRNIFLFFVIMLLVAFVVMALAGGMYVYLNGVKNLPSNEISESQPSGTIAPQAIVQATPIPTATPKPDYSLYNVSVLNGSGAIGAATAVKDLVQKGGFKVNYTGNAENFGYTDTIIQVKSTVSADVVAYLKNLLVPAYSVKIGTPLDSQSRWDIVVTVGSK
ncbi:MAG TPA: LytR C-terminal domain-containing protein [Patescibacteria group bacterium]